MTTNKVIEGPTSPGGQGPQKAPAFLWSEKAAQIMPGVPDS